MEIKNALCEIFPNSGRKDKNGVFDFGHDWRQTTVFRLTSVVTHITVLIEDILLPKQGCD
jgi:hypothetical protein